MLHFEWDLNVFLCVVLLAFPRWTILAVLLVSSTWHFSQRMQERNCWETCLVSMQKYRRRGQASPHHNHYEMHHVVDSIQTLHFTSADGDVTVACLIRSGSLTVLGFPLSFGFCPSATQLTEITIS